MNIQLEDAIKLLEEVQEQKTKLALVPHELVNKQYALLGAVEGVKSCISRLQEWKRRESYNA